MNNTLRLGVEGLTETDIRLIVVLLSSKFNNMKHIYLILSILTIFSLSTTAQNFQYDPAQHIDEEIQAENFSFHEIKMITHDLSGIHFRWILIDNTLPEGWSYSLCDLGGCYVGIPGSGTMAEISSQNALDGIQGFFKLNITASNYYGEGDAVFYVYEAGNTANGDTVSMHLSWADPSSGIADGGLNNIEIYPNPVQSDLFFYKLENIDKIEILGINGQILSSIQPNSPELKFDFRGFPGGVYFAKLTDDLGEVITKRIFKN